MFGRAAISLGIGPHPSCLCYYAAGRGNESDIKSSLFGLG